MSVLHLYCTVKILTLQGLVLGIYDVLACECFNFVTCKNTTVNWSFSDNFSWKSFSRSIVWNKCLSLYLCQIVSNIFMANLAGVWLCECALESNCVENAIVRHRKRNSLASLLSPFTWVSLPSSSSFIISYYCCQFYNCSYYYKC